MQIKVYTSHNVLEINTLFIDKCINNSINEWRYKQFSIGENAIFKTIEKGGNTIIIAFLIEEIDEGFTLSPAQIKGERILSFSEVTSFITEIIGLLVNKMWDSIDHITIVKNNIKQQ